ncbi:MAG: sporulation protein YabP [Clostridia bacterium]|nr:sporulation protein YabP [Clostridia bacterium]
MNVEAERSRRAEHKLTLCGRESLEVRGVTDVANFDEQTVVLNTLCGGMEIEGSALHIHVLNIEDGVVTLDGKIDSISYYEQESDGKDGKNGFFGRLFR